MRDANLVLELFEEWLRVELEAVRAINSLSQEGDADYEQVKATLNAFSRTKEKLDWLRSMAV